MRKLKVAVVDILGESVSKMSYSRHMRANNQSIGAQVVAVWCEELGHDWWQNLVQAFQRTGIK